nr:hypothetical protein [Tanacetum cinerariifolium]
SDSEEEDIPQVPNDVPSLAQSPELVKPPRNSSLISPPPMIPLHKVSTATPKSKPVLSAAARTIGADRPTFSKTRPHIASYTVSKSKAPIKRPFIRHVTPKPRFSPPRVNTANPSAVSAARVKAARPSAVSATQINAVKPFAVTAVQHNHTKKVWRPKTLV